MSDSGTNTKNKIYSLRLQKIMITCPAPTRNKENEILCLSLQKIAELVLNVKKGKFCV